MKTLLKAALLVLVGASLTTFLFVNPFGWQALQPLRHLLSAAPAADQAAHEGLWTCGMHPQVVSDEPGICPICHMDLTPLAGEPAPQSQPAARKWVCPVHPSLISEDAPGTCPIDGRALVLEDGHDHSAMSEGWWTCPMHPEIVSDEPGSCPICGMDLVFKEGGSAADSVDDLPIVAIEPGFVQRMNVRTETAERGDVLRQLRTVGAFAYDEERMVAVTTKFEGYIEKSHVSHVGQRVRRGAPLFEIYSRELVQTEQELLSALDYAERLAAADEDARARARGLVDAARQRLAWWDISEEQVRRIETGGTILRTLTITSPVSGIVMRRPPALEGMAVRPGAEIVHLVDASSLWLNTEIYEDQLASIEVGMPARVELDAYPGLALTGRVEFIDPQVTETTRTVPVTLSIPNEDGRLKVGMWATVRFESALATDVVTVSSQSVLRTGERSVVVIDLGDGRFVPRDVLLGPEGEGRVQIRRGLAAGERVVASAQFLIDSESNLRQAVQKMVAERRAQD